MEVVLPFYECIKTDLIQNLQPDNLSPRFQSYHKGEMIDVEVLAVRDCLYWRKPCVIQPETDVSVRTCCSASAVQFVELQFFSSSRIITSSRVVKFMVVATMSWRHISSFAVRH